MDENKKPIFAAYLNMARQNVFMTLLHISKLMGNEENAPKEDNMASLLIVQELGKKTKSERIQKIIQLLHKHFPFLKAMLAVESRKNVEYEEVKNKDGSTRQIKKVKPVQAKTYQETIISIIKLLNSLRNEYTHYSPVSDIAEQQKLESDFIGYLYNCLDGGRRVVKSRFEDINEEDLVFLTGEPRYNYITETDERGRTKVVETNEREDFYYRPKTNDRRFSQVGIALFTCLFIHKKYATQFLDQLSIFKPDCCDKEKKIIREIFSVYRIRLPKERMDSERPDYALGLDMLNELQRCPKELFETLEDDKQAEFRVKASCDDQGNTTENDEVLLLRHSDRFPYFALRYIDETNAFEKIRFQVALGSYRFKFYDKRCIDSKEKDRVRSLQKEIYWFGRLSEIERLRQEKWGAHIRTNDQVRKDTPGSEPYITDHHASYVFNGNRIGLSFNDANRNDSRPFPQLTFNKADEGKDAKGLPPMCWLSIYELPAMIFHRLLCKNQGNRTEDLIMTCVANYYRLFEDIRDGKLHGDVIFNGWSDEQKYSTDAERGKILTEGATEALDKHIFDNYHIHAKDVPDKLIEYLSDLYCDTNAKFTHLAGEHIKKMIESTQARLDVLKRSVGAVGSKDNKFGKKQYEDIRPGNLARFLAKDLLLMQPLPEDRKKLTGLNFQVLQSALAIYNLSIDELRTMFQEAGLMARDTGHPFLFKVLNRNPRSTVDFYKFYLLERKKYLENVKNNCDNYSNLPFLHSDRLKWDARNEDYYKDLADRYLADIFYLGEGKNEKQYTLLKPIELPHGLFTEDIKRILREDYGMELPDDKTKWHNATWLIDHFFSMTDGSQPFYCSEQYKRTYKIFNKLNNRRNGNKLIQTFYSVSEMEEWFEKNASGSTRFEQKRVSYLGNIQTGLERKGKRPDQIEKELKIEERRIKKYLNEYRDNEKAIRRLRVQDMLTFLMAKALLLDKFATDQTRDKIEAYKLRNISPINSGNENSILSLPIPFEITLTLKDGSKRTIRQEELKLKNYGDFFQFVYDERIRSLLPMVSEARIIDRAELETELDNYDNERPEVFRLVQELERAAFKKFPELRNEPYSTTETPRRNNFRTLVSLLQVLQEDELNRLIEVRNAFGHNRYTAPEKVALGIVDIPEIAKRILKIATELANKNK